MLLVGAIPVLSLRANSAEAGSPAVTGVVAGTGWKYRVTARDLPDIDNLVVARDGSLYATQELPPGLARVIQLRHGEVRTVIPGLSRADGLLLHGKFLYITERTAAGRVLEYDL